METSKPASHPEVMDAKMILDYYKRLAVFYAVDIDRNSDKPLIREYFKGARDQVMAMIKYLEMVGTK